MKTLETERLTIRSFVEADVETIYSLVYADSRVRIWWSNYEGTLDEFRARFRTDRLWNARDEFGYRALVRKSDGALLGLMGFQDHGWYDTRWLLMPDGSRNVGTLPGVLDVELTYAIGHAYWNNGYAAEAGRAMVDYGFAELGIDRIINAISPGNWRSRNLMIRLGFRFLDNGNPDDVIGLLESPGPLAKPET